MAAEVERALTYRNYVHAYFVYCADAGYTTVAEVRNRHNALGWSQAAQANGALSADLRRHLFRGWLTLEALIRSSKFGDYVGVKCAWDTGLGAQTSGSTW